MALSTVETKLVQLTREVDSFIARELATQMAEVAGFDSYQTADIETAVSEICSNVLRYGTRGWAALTVGPPGFIASVTDEGPGFDAAVPVRRGLGVGLAGARRLMDDLTIEALTRGSRVTIKKARRSADDLWELLPGWELAVVNRLKKGNSTSGDTWWSRPLDDGMLVAVVDGLGSGPQAQVAADSVVASFQSSDPTAPLDRLLSDAHRAARSTRGAVGVLVRVAGSTVEYCGVGDVSGRVEPGGKSLVLGAGIIGVDVGDSRVRHLGWSRDSAISLWTDGLEVPVASVADLGAGSRLGEALETLALEHGTDRDDGLFLLARQADRTQP